MSSTRSSGLLGNGRGHTIVGCLVCGFAAVAFFFSRGKNNAVEHIDFIEPQATPVTYLESIAPPANEAAIISTAGTPNPFFNMRNFKREFLDATNYWQLAQSLLPASAAAEPDAQYYLYKALAYCAKFYDPFFRSTDATAPESAITKGLPPTLAQTVFDRCHDLQKQVHASPVTISPGDWLERAAANGQRLAAMDIALTTLNQARSQQNAPEDANADRTIYYAPNPISVLREALASGDPDALFEMSSVPPKTPQNSERSVDSMAWRLVACQRGYDCSETADWVAQACEMDQSCVPGASGTDVVLNTAGDRLNQVKKRAAEIGAQLDASDWDQLISDVRLGQ